MHFPNPAKLIALAALLAASQMFASCSHPGVANSRQSALDNRQDRMDARTDARTQRWQTRGDREDARAQARFDAM